MGKSQQNHYGRDLIDYNNKTVYELFYIYPQKKGSNFHFREKRASNNKKNIFLKTVIPYRFVLSLRVSKAV